MSEQNHTAYIVTRWQSPQEARGIDIVPPLDEEQFRLAHIAVYGRDPGDDGYEQATEPGMTVFHVRHHRTIAAADRVVQTLHEAGLDISMAPEIRQVGRRAHREAGR